MTYRFDYIQTFLQIMETSSISASSRRMVLSKLVVSKRITDLGPPIGLSCFTDQHPGDNRDRAYI
ncbi:MAG: LysR family transcriptional regulator [Nitrosomonadaceae bacterium]|nr:LysR family transcriptional regulator [Nitrosomonadaceae bacterium]